MNKKNKEQPKVVTNFCRICNKLIFFNVDDYCHLLDYYKGKFLREGFYHTKCFNDKIKGNAELDLMKKKAMALLNKAGEMIGMSDDKPMEVVHI